MSLLAEANVQEGLVSIGLLLGAYLAARFVSFLLGWLLERAARQATAASLDDHLLSALKQPITYLLFIVGAWGALHRLPAPAGIVERLDLGLFVIGVLLVTLALMRTYGILLSWYTSARFTDGSGLAAEFGPMLRRLGQLFLAVLAAIAILQQLGVNVMSLVVSLGVGSLAVGLAAQDTLANMFAGFALMLDRPFRIGDRIQLASGEVGDVEQVGMRATRITTADDTVLVVPNSALVKERLVNLSRPTRAVVARLEVGVGLDADLALVRRVLTESALAVRHVDPERTPVVLFTKFTDYAIVSRLVFWARDYADQSLALSGVLEEIQRRFKEAGIAIPFPRRTVVQEGAAAPHEV